MALRRPPTRIELKTEDMVEYEELQQRLQLQSKQQATLGTGTSTTGQASQRGTSASTSTTTAPTLSVQDRIGLTSQSARHPTLPGASGGGDEQRQWMRRSYEP